MMRALRDSPPVMVAVPVTRRFILSGLQGDKFLLLPNLETDSRTLRNKNVRESIRRRRATPGGTPHRGTQQNVPGLTGSYHRSRQIPDGNATADRNSRPEP